MEAQKDFSELLTLLNAHRVEYLIVGAYALAAFGFRFPNLTVEDFQDQNKVVQLGLPPVRIDLLTSITGVTWEQAQAQKAAGTFGDVPVCYLGRNQYIINKRAIGRKKDLADLEALGEA